MSNTPDKVLFGVWSVVTVLYLIAFIGGVIVQNYDLDDLILALWGAVICGLHWRLWHEKSPTTTLNVIISERGNDD